MGIFLADPAAKDEGGEERAAIKIVAVASLALRVVVTRGGTAVFS
jgi:hypothetical protein